MDIEVVPHGYCTAATRLTSAFTSSANLQLHSKADQHSFRTLLPLFPIGNKSDSAKKFLRLGGGREVERDECLFIVPIGRVMELLETY
jgi:hypothetical protein